MRALYFGRVIAPVAIHGKHQPRPGLAIF
jgi:hypothetical protein